MKIIREGFVYKGFKFGFNNKTLYRLSINKGNRSYPSKEIPIINLSRTSKGYRLVRDKKSFAQIRSMVKKVNWKINNTCKECA